MAAYRRVDDLRSPAGWLPVHRDQLRAQRSVSSTGSLYLYLLHFMPRQHNTGTVSTLARLSRTMTLCWTSDRTTCTAHYHAGFLTAVTFPPFKFTNRLKTAKYLHFFVLLIPHIHDAMKFFAVLPFQSCTRGHHCSVKSQTGFSNWRRRWKTTHALKSQTVLSAH